MSDKNVSGNAQLALAVEDPELQVIAFGAKWCGPWQLAGRMREQLGKKLRTRGVGYREADVDADRSLAARFRVVSLPTFLIVAGGGEIARRIGATNLEELDAWVAQYEEAGR